VVVVWEWSTLALASRCAVAGLIFHAICAQFAGLVSPPAPLRRLHAQVRPKTAPRPQPPRSLLPCSLPLNLPPASSLATLPDSWLAAVLRVCVCVCVFV